MMRSVQFRTNNSFCLTKKTAHPPQCPLRMWPRSSCTRMTDLEDCHLVADCFSKLSKLVYDRLWPHQLCSPQRGLDSIMKEVYFRARLLLLHSISFNTCIHRCAVPVDNGVKCIFGVSVRDSPHLYLVFLIKLPLLTTDPIGPSPVRSSPSCCSRLISVD